MKRSKDTELQQLEKGLQAAKPLDDLIGSLAAQNDAEVLYDKGGYYLKWTGLMMAIAGIYFLALKEKVGHGSFKKFFIGKDRPVSYMHAWQCMKAAEVVAEHSVFGELRSSRAFRNLLLLPAPDRVVIAEEIQSVPLEQVSELLPDKIQKRYDELKGERARAKIATERAARRAADGAADEAQSATAAAADIVPTRLEVLIGRAEAALYEIYNHEIPPAEWPACRKYLDILTRAKDRAAYTLSDPTHSKPPWWEQRPSAADFDDMDEERP